MNNSGSFVLAMGVLLAGGLVAYAVFGLRSSMPAPNVYELNQQGPIFIRFNTQNGEVCFTGITPNPNQKTLNFLTKTWICLDGKATKPGESLEEIMEKMPELQGDQAITPPKNRKGK